jgi:hypothetical protein
MNGNRRRHDQEWRERALRRYMLEQDRARITELKTWLHGRPEDEHSIAVGRALGEIAPGYLTDCERLEVQP